MWWIAPTLVPGRQRDLAPLLHEVPGRRNGVAKNVEQDRRARNYAIAFAAALAVSGIAALAIALARQV